MFTIYRVSKLRLTGHGVNAFRQARPVLSLNRGGPCQTADGCFMNVFGFREHYSGPHVVTKPISAPPPNPQNPELHSGSTVKVVRVQGLGYSRAVKFMHGEKDSVVFRASWY